MKKNSLKLLALAGLMVLRGCTPAFASTITNNVVDATGNAAVKFVRFQPLFTRIADGSRTVIGYPARANVDTNNNFSVSLVGGPYDVYFGNDATLPPLRIRVPMNDTNTWNLNQVAKLAVNASMFNETNIVIDMGGSVSTDTNSGTATSLTGGAVAQVRGLVLSAGSVVAPVFSATNTAIAYVRTNGDDGSGTLGSSLYPFASISAAVGTRTNILVDLGAGWFGVTNQTLLSGVSIIGKGTNQTFIFMDTSGQKSGLIISGNNIYLRDFTIGTNMLNGTYYFPLSVSSGISNFIAQCVNIVGGSDGLWADGLTAYTAGEFYYCGFNTGFDCAHVFAANPIGAVTNSFFGFYNCAFNSTNDPIFAVGSIGISTSAVKIFVQNCTFNITNSVSDAYGISAGYTPSSVIVQDNTFNVGGVTASIAVSATGTLVVRGGSLTNTYSSTQARSWQDVSMPNGFWRRLPLY